MRRFLAPLAPDSIDAKAITALKVDIVGALIDDVTGVMLEPEFSIPQISASGMIPRRVGIIAALEAQGYLDDPSTAVTSVLDGWSIEQAQAAGAAMVKLLLPYRPDSALADRQEAVAAQIIADSRRCGIGLVLEPLPWDVVAPLEHVQVIVEIARRFAPLGPDLLKLPFPGLGRADTKVATQACENINDICPMPWALLSGGGTFEAFADQLTISVAAGCAGYMVGRALWGDAASSAPAERLGLLTAVVRPRLARLNRIVASRQSAR